MRSPDRSGQVRKLVDQMLHYWHVRDQMPPDSRYIRGQFYERNNRIFYDTDYIEERQLERLKLCDHCPGYLSIESYANHGLGKSGKVKCLSVPFTTCEKCRSEAIEAYHQAKKRGIYRYVYHQDNSADIFFGYDTGSGKEWQSEG